MSISVIRVLSKARRKLTSGVEGPAVLYFMMLALWLAVCALLVNPTWFRALAFVLGWITVEDAFHYRKYVDNAEREG